ncbi:MAG TPA: thioesterase [Anaerovoracaceae bacterium]|nr:thioesterase [Anaerovoracaceae bacterium]
MPFIQKDMPQYHYADDDGLIGLRGIMHYFQNIHTWHLHSINKGNDVIPQQYGAGWIYTRYHAVLKQKIDYMDGLTLKAWMEPYRQPVLVNENVEIHQHGKLVACGKLEGCVFSLTRQRPLRLSAIEFPEDFAEDIPNEIPDFLGIEKTAEGTEPRYTRMVRTSDLDVNRHMNNLRYIEMFQDVYDSKFWREFAPTEMEIRFMSQCREGEEISVCSRVDGSAVRLAALHQDGQIAAVAEFRA